MGGGYGTVKGKFRKKQELHVLQKQYIKKCMPLSNVIGSWGKQRERVPMFKAARLM